MNRLLSLLLASTVATSLSAQAVKVEIEPRDGGGYQILRNDAPYYVKGAGGVRQLDMLAALGGNSVRTWGEDQMDEVLDDAQAHGLTVLAGLWMNQERQGMDYTDPEAAAAEVERHKAAVLKYKDHPAILMWAVGNELEIHHANPVVWDAVEELAQWIKSVDPNHPVITVTAFPSAEDLHEIRRRAPSLDAIGCNAYAALPILPQRMEESWGGPYLVTEWGPDGQWESATTAWGVPVEPTSTEKAQRYRERYQYIENDPNCLGSYAFWWGQKTEATLTWFGMFLENGLPLGAVDAMQRNWTGEWPSTQAPVIQSFRLNGHPSVESLKVAPGSKLDAVLAVQQASDQLSYSWELTHDEHRPPQGGDPEPRPETVDTTFRQEAGKAEFTAPAQAGMYRLYAYVTDADGKAATASFPFLVTAADNAGSPSVVETSRDGGSFVDAALLELHTGPVPEIVFELNSGERHQTIEGIGGAFTESSAYVLQQMPDDKRSEVLEALFSPEGANYSLMRTHVGGCDFSLASYNYDPVPGDTALEHFSVKEDEADLIPLIKDSQSVSRDGFRILSSPWTAPSWMKDNNSPLGGRLLDQYYQTFADYYAKYVKAYAEHGIDIWAVTPLNEPEGNGGKWDSMIMHPDEEARFVRDNLGPTFEREGIDAKIFIFDQNRGEAEAWTDAYYSVEGVRDYTDGVALHWYSSTVDYYPEVIRGLMDKYPGQQVMHTEGCIDSINDVPQGAWLEADWYWRKECMDWGYRWAPPNDRHEHPKYAPFYRYARDLLGGLQSGMSGWIDWNIVLNFQGGPNHAENWCLAPILCDPETSTVFKTPLYYAVAHFSKFIRPGAVRIGCPEMVLGLMSGAFQNTDGSIVLILLNEEKMSKAYAVKLDGRIFAGKIDAEAIQTIVFPPKK